MCFFKSDIFKAEITPGLSFLVMLWHPLEVNYPDQLISLRKQAGAELGQAQLKLELELSFTWFEICCIKLINKNTAGYIDYHYQVPTTKHK